jgi:hypothetical protein
MDSIRSDFEDTANLLLDRCLAVGLCTFSQAAAWSGVSVWCSALIQLVLLKGWVISPVQPLRISGNWAKFWSSLNIAVACSGGMRKLFSHHVACLGPPAIDGGSHSLLRRRFQRCATLFAQSGDLGNVLDFLLRSRIPVLAFPLSLCP